MYLANVYKGAEDGPLVGVTKEDADKYSEEQDLDCYSYKMHWSAFVMPKYVKEVLDQVQA